METTRVVARVSELRKESVCVMPKLTRKQLTAYFVAAEALVIILVIVKAIFATPTGLTAFLVIGVVYFALLWLI